MQVESVFLDPKELFAIISNLNNSINYIENFLKNPIYIIKEEWKIMNIQDNVNDNYLVDYFNRDPTLQQFIWLLEVTNKNKNDELAFTSSIFYQLPIINCLSCKVGDRATIFSSEGVRYAHKVTIFSPSFVSNTICQLLTSGVTSWPSFIFD